MTQYITTAGFQALKEEFEYLKLVERPKIVDDVAAAAAQGDRSENAEYIYGKKRMREIDGRLRFLSKNFEDMQAIDPKTPRGNKVFFGATVTVYDEEKEDEITFQLVGPMDKLDPEHISYQSPVGQALLGRTLDDEVVIKTPALTRHLTIMNIEYI